MELTLPFAQLRSAARKSCHVVSAIFCSKLAIALHLGNLWATCANTWQSEKLGRSVKSGYTTSRSEDQALGEVRVSDTILTLVSYLGRAHV